MKSCRYFATKLTNNFSHLKQEKGRPLPKFGEWDVNNPASAEGFTVIFSKARDAKKSNGATGPGTGTGNGTGTGSEATATATTQRNDNSSRPPVENIQYTPMVNYTMTKTIAIKEESYNSIINW